MTARPHTGRRRNDGARRAILDAAAELMSETGAASVTVDAVAARAGVGRQTIYRWWPSKGAVLLEAMTERAAAVAPLPGSTTMRDELRAFVADTFAGAGSEAAALRAVMAEAQRDPHTSELLTAFTAERRRELRSLLDRAAARGETPVDDGGRELVVDQVFGVLWYRLLTGHGTLDRAEGARLADVLGEQLGAP